MEKLLKDWRQDAINKHQYDSAIFIGDKLLALTSESFITIPLRYADAY
jgi:anaphase-promoting complex subunit 6